MDLIEEELNRLRIRLDELVGRIIPDLENKAQMLYARIMPLREGTEERDRLESEYTLLSKELRLRSDELYNARQQIENLELQKTLKH